DLGQHDFRVYQRLERFPVRGGALRAENAAGDGRHLRFSGGGGKPVGTVHSDGRVDHDPGGHDRLAGATTYRARVEPGRHQGVGRKIRSRGSPERMEQGTPMNVIFISIDSLSKHFLKAYGQPIELDVQTPNIDRFAEKALVFDNHYAGSLPCMPARREFFSGTQEFLWRPW